MKRTGNWWNLVSVVLATLLLLVALGCNSTMQIKYPSTYSPDRTGTVSSLWPKQHGASRVD